jgi:formate-dependent nitrite reductase membrane component NrfD
VSDPAEAPNDGHNIDLEVGRLEGEAAQQKVPPERGRGEGTVPFTVWTGGAAADDGRTYYDRPVIKAPVWKPLIAAYFYVGGAAGAAAALGAAAQTIGGGELRGLVRRCRWISAVGCAVGGALLVEDLGRPSRFLNMLRVIRPSSPMSIGSWVLAGSGSAAGVSALLSGARGPLGAVGDAAGAAAGALGLPLASYTGVLLNNTVVPVWEQPRRSLAPLFVASGMAAAGSLLDLMPGSARERRVARRFGVVGRLAELVLAKAVEREAGRVPRVAKPLQEGRSGSLWRAAEILTAASLGLSLLPRRLWWARPAAGVTGTLGSLLLRFGVFFAGRASANDPRATFALQRAGGGGADAVGRAAVTGPGGRRAV